MANNSAPADLDAFWMPFTANRAFKSKPRLLTSAAGMYYESADGRRILDGTAGLWCVNAGHSRPKIVEAVQRQVALLDFAPTFQMGHPLAFELAHELIKLLPSEFDRVFFANSGSEAVDSALKIALAYHRARGEGSRTRLIGRERAYHGVGFGGTSVGGIVKNRMWYGTMLPGIDHLPHTHSLEHNAFSRGQPSWGVHLADELERVVNLHDASNIAAVIVEPVAGSTGVLIPPKGYLEKLRAICDKHGILLIFDEVITGFGRLGCGFGMEYFGVTPDLVTVAKGMTNGTIPAGAVFTHKKIYEALAQGPDNAIDLFHGYTYSGHPMAMAAGLATLQTYAEEQLFERARDLTAYWEDAVHSLRGLPHVVDLRNIGLIGAIEFAPAANKPVSRAFDAFVQCFKKGLLTRATGDILALSPPLIVEKKHIDDMFGILRDVLKN